MELQEFRVEIARRLCAVRHEHELTQEALAEQLGISARHVQFLEAARRGPSMELLFALGRCFGIKPGYFLDIEVGRADTLGSLPSAAEAQTTYHRSGKRV